MTQFEMAVKVESLLDESLPRLISLAQRGLPCKRLAESIKDEAISAINHTGTRFTWMQVRRACCEVAGITQKKFEEGGRYYLPRTARQVFAFICSKHGLLTLKEMGEVCGGLDHTTMVHGRDVVRDLLKVGDERMTNFYNDVVQILTTE